MPRLRALLLHAVAPLLLHALAREADRALGLLLRAEIEPRALLPELAAALAADGGAVPLRLLAWLAAGLGLWAALAIWSSRAEALPLGTALERETATLAPLWLRPALTILALVSVALRPSYPYAFTLPVALTQDWSLGQDVAALASVVALRAPALRWPAPRGGEVFFVAFLLYAALAPGWAFRWEGHPGNEPKYLRQAVALGQLGSFDAEGVRAVMETLPVRPPGGAAAAAVSTFFRESRGMLAAVAQGEAGRDAIRATRVTRQTVRGKDGGVFYVLAPGPSLLLAPTLRLDRALNLARGATGRVAASTLLWCALGALLVAALFALVRDATGTSGLAAAAAFIFALLPPFLFFFYQYYPELPGALVLAVAFRALALRPAGLVRHPWRFGWMLAALPWLHQKFLPAWLVLTLTAVGVVWCSRGGGPSGPALWRAQVGLLLPQAVSLYLTALYNFAITGSVRPDALFLAWGPGGVTGARVGQGVLGLLLDARYGLLPYVPLLLLAAAGLALGGARRFAVVLPAAGAYYLTVASADNWAGAVCNLGRYFMPVAPLAVVLAALAVHHASGEAKTRGQVSSCDTRGPAALVLALAAWSGLFALALWRDPQAANDSGLLLARSSYGDGNQYIPNLFLRHWSDAAPGLWARIAAWVAAAGLLAAGLRRVSSPRRALAAIAVVVLALAFVLEQWPSRRGGLVHADGLPAPAAPPAAATSPADTLVLFDGAVRVREDEAILGPGGVTLLVRQRTAAPAADRTAPTLRAIVGGEGVLRVDGLPPVSLRPTGGVVDLPLLTYHVVAGAGGRRAVFSRLGVAVAGQAVMRFSAGEPGPVAPMRPAPAADERGEQDAEPGEPGPR